MLTAWPSGPAGLEPQLAPGDRHPPVDPEHRRVVHGWKVQGPGRDRNRFRWHRKPLHFDDAQPRPPHHPGVRPLVRLFVAVPLPTAAHAAAAEVLEQLRGLGWPVRWVRPDGLHITLKFFGEVVPERFDVIEEMIGFAVRGMPPIHLTIAGAGAFPDLQRPRVLRLDLGGAFQELELLQDRLERGGLSLGFAPEGRPFLPHITLGRVKEGQRLPPDAPAILTSIAGLPMFRADKVILFESLQGELGPRYDPRLELELGV